MRTIKKILLAMALVAGGQVGASAETERSPLALKDMAAAVASGVAVVRDVTPEGTGAAVFIFPEDHFRKDGQFEEAVSLLRLSQLQSISGIILEGMSPSKAVAVATMRTSISLSSALPLIQEGDISAAELMSLVYGTHLLAGETEETAKFTDSGKGTDLCGGLVRAANQYHRTTLSKDWSQDDKAIRAIAAINDTETEMAAIPNVNTCQNKRLYSQNFSKQRAAYKTYLEALSAKLPDMASADWVCSASPATAMGEIETGIGSLERASTFLRSEPELHADKLASELDEYRRSLMVRDDASREMVRQATVLSGAAHGSIAMIIGAAHTLGVTSRLEKAGIPYAVIENRSLRKPIEKAQLLTLEQGQRRYKLMPTANTPFNAALVTGGAAKEDCNLPRQHKYDTILTEDWLQKKVQIYQAISNFGRASLTGAPAVASAWNGIIDESRARIFKNRAGHVAAVVVPVTIRSTSVSGTSAMSSSTSVVWTVIRKGTLFEGDGDKIDEQKAEKALIAMAGDGGGNDLPPDGHTTSLDAQPDGPNNRNESRPEENTENRPQENGGKDAREGLEIYASSDVKFSSFRDEKSALEEAQRLSAL